LAADDPLLSALRALRTRLAKAENVPAYVIFSDRSLQDMAAIRPKSLAALRSVHGVGEAKLARYGRVFLEAVAEHASA
jgi:ATP-dependent DNA helicase RecQ